MPHRYLKIPRIETWKRFISKRSASIVGVKYVLLIFKLILLYYGMKHEQKRHCISMSCVHFNT